MSLNIKKERVHALAREAARATGRSQTGAVEEALELLLEKYGAQPAATDRQRRLDTINDAALAWRPTPTATPGEVEQLYDDATGLPI